MNLTFTEEQIDNALKFWVNEIKLRPKGFNAQNFLREALLEYGVCKIRVTLCLEHHSGARDFRHWVIDSGDPSCH